MTLPKPLNKPHLIRMHPNDNVAIVGNDGGLAAGTVIPGGPTLQDKVPQAHKVALSDFAAGQAVIRYGVTIGYALKDIPAGSWVHEKLLRMPEARNFENLPIATVKPKPTDPLTGFTFEGYRNEDGSVQVVLNGEIYNYRELAQGLLDLGLLDRSKVGDAEAVVAERAYFRFYMHRTSHWLGMDVHDCGSYVEPGEASEATPERDPLTGQSVLRRPSRILRPGMMLTIEPGLYVRPADDVPEAFWNLGIRIEDDALVTANGCELITRGVPVEADAIEALMRD